MHDAAFNGETGYDTRTSGDALARLRALAADGDPEAQFRLGRLHLLGGIGPMPERTALLWLTKAARHDHAQAQYDVAVMHLAGEGCDVDTARGMHWLARAAANGQDLAARLLAKIYRTGLYGVGRDSALAALWTARAPR